MALKRVIVYGGNGALGSACVASFKAKKWWVASVDLGGNAEADLSVVLDGDQSLERQSAAVLQAVEAELAGHRVQAVLCVAGGWAGGSITAKNVLSSCELMWKQSVASSLLAARLAERVLAADGLLQLTGAKAALDATPGMLGYGMAKCAVHHLTTSLAAGAEDASSSRHVLAILPVTLDTANNRKFMPSADTSTWTPLSYVVDLLYDWSNDPASRPVSGRLVQLITDNGVTRQVEVHT